MTIYVGQNSQRILLCVNYTKKKQTPDFKKSQAMEINKCSKLSVSLGSLGKKPNQNVCPSASLLPREAKVRGKLQ